MSHPTTADLRKLADALRSAAQADKAGAHLLYLAEQSDQRNGVFVWEKGVIKFSKDTHRKSALPHSIVSAFHQEAARLVEEAGSLLGQDTPDPNDSADLDDRGERGERAATALEAAALIEEYAEDVAQGRVEKVHVEGTRVCFQTPGRSHLSLNAGLGSMGCLHCACLRCGQMDSVWDGMSTVYVFSELGVVEGALHAWVSRLLRKNKVEGYNLLESR